MHIASGDRSYDRTILHFIALTLVSSSAVETDAQVCYVENVFYGFGFKVEFGLQRWRRILK